MTDVSVTGRWSRERLAAPVAETRDVQIQSGQGRASLYDEITDKIIAELEAGRVPWVQPLGDGRGKGAAGNAKERLDRDPPA